MEVDLVGEEGGGGGEGERGGVVGGGAGGAGGAGGGFEVGGGGAAREGWLRRVCGGGGSAGWGDSRWVDLLAGLDAAAGTRLPFFLVVVDGDDGGDEERDGGFFAGRAGDLHALVEGGEAGVLGEAGLVRAHVFVQGVFQLGFLQVLVAVERRWTCQHGARAGLGWDGMGEWVLFKTDLLGEALEVAFALLLQP